MRHDPGGSLTVGRAQPPASPGESEAADVALAQSGDGRAFERLYRAQAARIHSLVRRMVPDTDADELTQDVFVRAWQKLGGFRGEAAFGTWLHRLAVNLILSRRAELAQRRTRYTDDDAPLAELPGRRAGTDAAMDLETALRALPDGARMVFVLHDVEGYRHDEIAERLGIAEGTSKSQLHRARMALRARLSR